VNFADDIISDILKVGLKLATTNYQKQRLKNAYLRMLEGTMTFMHAYEAHFEQPIGEDGYCGPAIAEILSGLKALLNTEVGDLDLAATERRMRELANRMKVDYPV
jgi:hypothetical protein